MEVVVVVLYRSRTAFLFVLSESGQPVSHQGREGMVVPHSSTTVSLLARTTTTPGRTRNGIRRDDNVNAAPGPAP